jgi:hypothetical protein
LLQDGDIVMLGKARFRFQIAVNTDPPIVELAAHTRLLEDVPLPAP